MNRCNWMKTVPPGLSLDVASKLIEREWEDIGATLV